MRVAKAERTTRMSKVIGIDLGTTNSCVAVVEGGKPVVITNAEGERTTPSVVAFTKDGERLVGGAAKRQLATNSGRTVSSIKRHMGSDYRVHIDGRDLTPQEISAMILTKIRRDASDYSGYMLFFFASGKCAKIPLSSYATKQNRRKLLKAYCDKEPLATMFFLPEETELAIRTSAGRMLLVGTAQIAAKTTRDSQGVAVVTLKKNQTIASVVPADTLELANPHRYRVRSLPATGALVRAEDEGEQMTML